MAYIMALWSVCWQHNFDGKGDMTTGTVIMIVCAVLYGLIVIIFKDDRRREKKEEPYPGDDRFIGADGTPGGRGFCSKDFDSHHVK